MTDEKSQTSGVDEKAPATVHLFTAADKQGAAFCCGALIALRDLNLLLHCQNLLAVGSANFMLLAFARSLNELRGDSLETRWATINDTTSGTDVLSTFLLRHARELLCVNHELALLKTWISNPAFWLSPRSDITQLYVRNAQNDLNLTTGSLQVDSRKTGGPVAMPVLAFVGTAPSSYEEIAFTTESNPGMQQTDLCKLYCSSAYDYLAPLCFAMGAPEPYCGLLSGTDVPVTNGINTSPIPLETSNTLFTRTRMCTRFDAFDKLGCNRLVLIDAYTHSPAFKRAHAPVSAAALTAVATVLGPASSEATTSLRAYNRTCVQQYDRIYNTPNLQKKTAKALFSAFRKTFTCLEALTDSEFQLSVNWGYILTRRRFGVIVDDVCFPFPEHAWCEELREIIGS